MKNIEELNALKCKTSLREIEALGLHTLKRFLTKYNRFSPMILPPKVSTLFLKGTFVLDEMLRSPSRIFSVSLFLVELFQTYSLTVTSYSKAMIKVIMSTLIGLKKVLGDRKWVLIELDKETNLITLKNKKICIDFLVLFTVWGGTKGFTV